MIEQKLTAEPLVILSEAKDLFGYIAAGERSFALSGAQDDVTPFLVVEFATELEEDFVYATMEVASE